MKTLVAASLILPLALVCVAALANVITFDNLPVGSAPAGWTATKTGTGNAKWTVEKDATAPSKPNVKPRTQSASKTTPT